ncbi:MAG: hypothetical protein GY910_20725, partial [bacterium]|nr:hypothetical protein [bacterium]
MTNALLRMPELSDGISGIDDWMRTVPHKTRGASLDLCKVTIRQNAARRRFVFSVPDSAVEHLGRRGGEIEASESLDDGDETFPFSKLQGRLLLGTAKSASPPNARLILIEDQNPGAFSDLLSALSTIRSTSQELLVFESASKRRIPGIRLTGVEPHDLNDGILGSARSLQIRDLGFDVATPTGFIHPMAEACPELIRIQNPGSDLLLWNSNPGDEQRGAFVPLSVLERRRRQPADYFRFTPKSFITSEPENDVSPEPIDIRLVKILDRKRDEDRRRKQIILELKDPTGTQNIRRLFDTMDEAESGLFDTDARIWTSRPGKSAAGLTTHRILFRTESPLAEVVGPDVRAFVQPSAFEARGIPLFVELGHRLHPAADAFIDELPIDHPLASQFTEMFPAESEGRDCHHLLRMNPHGMPSHHVLRGGELLRDHIGPIVAETIALPPDTSTDSNVSRKLAESIRSARDRNLENIRATGADEAEAVIGEFDEVLAELSRHVDQLEKQLDGSASKAKVLTEVATHLEIELAKSPGDWWRLDALVGRLNNDIIKPREDWVAKLDSATRQFEVGQKAALSRLADAAAIVEERLGLIRGWVKTSETARSALQRNLEQAAQLQHHLKRVAAKAAEDHANATAMLVSVSKSLEAEDRRLQSSEDRLRKKKAALEDQ